MIQLNYYMNNANWIQSFSDQEYGELSDRTSSTDEDFISDEGILEDIEVEELMMEETTLAKDFTWWYMEIFFHMLEIAIINSYGGGHFQTFLFRKSWINFLIRKNILISYYREKIE